MNFIKLRFTSEIKQVYSEYEYKQEISVESTLREMPATEMFRLKNDKMILFGV
jgi:hypothetical protein